MHRKRLMIGKFRGDARWNGQSESIPGSTTPATAVDLLHRSLLRPHLWNYSESVRERAASQERLITES